MSPNFSVADVFGTLLALAVFPLVAFIPGYTLGWLLDLVGFRRRTPLLRVCLSIPLSISLTPVIFYLLGRQFTVGAVWVFFVALAVTFLSLFLRDESRPFAGKWPRVSGKIIATVAIVWTAVPVLSLIDLQLGHRLYYSVVSYDYSVRSAVISALARVTYYPPTDPFFFAGQPSPFRYHYFWFLLCSLPNRILTPIFGSTVVGPRHTLIAGVVVIGFALIATVVLYLRFFSTYGAANIRRRTGIVVALLCISGLDVLISGAKLLVRIVFQKNNVNATVDWWNNDQVTGWLGSALWVPHHLAGLLACLMGFLILWDHHHTRIQRPRWQIVLGAALCFAGAAGLSVYVAFVFAAFLAAWGIFLFQRKDYPELTALIATGLLAGVLALPYLLELIHAGSAGSVGATTEQSSFVRWGVRQFTPMIVALTAIHRDNAVTLAVTNLIFLPLNYFLEFGFFFVVAFLRLRHWRKKRTAWTRYDMASLLMFAIPLIVCTFVRSNTITNNDLGMRGMLIVQFVLLLWGVDLVSGIDLRRAGRLLTITFIVGASTNVYEVILLRTFTLVSDAKFNPGTNNLIQYNTDFGRRVFDNREAYEWLDRHTSLAAVVQQFPDGVGDFSPGLYSNRQIALLDYPTAISFGGDPVVAKTMQEAIAVQFAPSAPINRSLCGNLPIDYVMVRSGNQLWHDPSSWVWHRTPVFMNQNARAFSCH